MTFDTRTERGLVWPAKDRECARAVFGTVSDMDFAIDLCPRKLVAVQAGGNCGVWPMYLADKFRAVYTFEPDPLNFYCLAQNVMAANVVKFQAALGCVPERMDLARDPRNIGAHYVDGTGILPVMRLDDLHLTECDYICLDVEGYELDAIRGARETITRCSPVIQLEDKGLSTKYGHDKGAVVEYLLAAHGYTVRKEIHRDFILARGEA